MVSFLRHQTQVLEEEKQLSRHEADRLRGEVATLKRTLDALRSQVITSFNSSPYKVLPESSIIPGCPS